MLGQNAAHRASARPNPRAVRKENAMRRFNTFAVIGALSIAATTYAAAGKAPESWVTGRLERFDPTAKSVVVTQGSHEMTFALGSGAQLMFGKKALQPSDLTTDIGHQVKIRYSLNGSNKVADRIEVLAASTAQTAKK
jgi:hypothetical protein